MSAPSSEVVSALEAGRSRIVRRVEIYESDGITLWNPDLQNDPEFKRLVDGSITLDYSRSERRICEFTFRNDDGLLRPDSIDGLWYDKVIKPYRGIEYALEFTEPSIAVIDADISSYSAIEGVLKAIGFSKISDMTSIASAAELDDFDVIASFGSSSTKAAILIQLWNSGRSVVTFGMKSTANLPWVSTTTVLGAGTTIGIDFPTEDSPLSDYGWTTEANATTVSGTVPTGVVAGSQRIAVWANGGLPNPPIVSAAFSYNPSGGRWFHMHLPNTNGSQSKILLKGGINLARGFKESKIWEIQMGEFMIDNIDDQNFPFQVKVTGRDYTKKMLGSKLEKAVTFQPGTTTLGTFVRALAANAGITKFNIPSSTPTINTTISADRGTERWNLCSEAASSFGYELFFDNVGALTLREFRDPAAGGATHSFKTGLDGNLVSFSRSTSDSRIYNHICVYGDPSEGDGDRLPYFGEAKNEDPGSPTRIQRIGDRYFSFASSFFTNDQQAQDLAEQLLKIHALEQYQMSISSIYYPWLEVGEVVEIIDPKALTSDPTRYLLDTLTFPMGLGPMTGTAKRVTFVSPSIEVIDSGEYQSGGGGTETPVSIPFTIPRGI